MIALVTATALGSQAQGLPEGLAEATGHETVEHRVGGRAEVEEDTRYNVHKLEGQDQALGPVGHQAPHEAVSMEWSPADAKHHNQRNCKDREDRPVLIGITLSVCASDSLSSHP